ncbi:MAG: DJ-1/PfpI family protein [Bacteroidota bacterium]
MKKIKKAVIITITILVVLAGFLYYRLQPVFELGRIPVYKGNTDFTWKVPAYDSSKKTVIIIADNDLTEIFDLLAPFYLFNATGKANVYVVAEKKYPVTLSKGFFILPSFSFAEIDSLKIHPDVIVIPNQSVKVGKPQKAATLKWIKDHYTTQNSILSICDGSVTAAATGLYDNKPLTTHASDFNDAKKTYPKPTWVKNVSVTQSGNLFSTAGVSNAVEGSLVVIKHLFGSEIMQKVLIDVKYPHSEIKMDHKSLPVNTGAIITVLSKIIFRKNLTLGVMLQDGINEFELAGLIDTYTRTLPASIETFVSSGSSVTSKYGLVIYPTGNFHKKNFDEVHVLMPELITGADEKLLQTSTLVKYDQRQSQYPFDIYLSRIADLYGPKIKDGVKLMLDYN